MGFIKTSIVCPDVTMAATAIKGNGLATMPKGSKVHRQYDAMRDKGMPKGKAARIAQANTGQALATGKSPKRKGGGGKRKR